MYNEELTNLDLTNKIVVLHKEAVRGGKMEDRIFKINGGFGTSPTAIGSAIFGVHLDGECVRWERGHVERLATQKELDQYGTPPDE